MKKVLSSADNDVSTDSSEVLLRIYWTLCLTHNIIVGSFGAHMRQTNLPRCPLKADVFIETLQPDT